MSSDLPSLLLASLHPASRKQAEQSLGNQDGSVCLSAGVYLKNVTKLRQEEDINPIPAPDKVELRKALVPMLHLSARDDKIIHAQVTESVNLIAELDFPERWPDLIDVSPVFSNPTSSSRSTNNLLLTDGHDHERPWRAHFHSDALFSEINCVLSRFMDPFLQLFRNTAGLLLAPAPSAPAPALVRQMTLLLEIYYDFTCQDLPPAIEDAHEEF
ncbi:Cse1-domain-containing protein [Athelia psychrophila]|uniref:Cse1-domain-containing protein n=1 Tax=Athelia psychrophila TaxID=1759441 RepID=A0A165WSM4_9AGAM|nr:Cse1-domain-containing protein [Fibularhizoctonia sp. CBS 109695]